MTGERVRAGLVGPGGIGHVHARALAAIGVEIGAVAASSPASAERHARELGVAVAADSAEELIARADVDVVHICAPNACHAPLARLALEAGKHVVCEKPLATTLADAYMLADLAESRPQVTAVGYYLRAMPRLRELRQQVAQGALGDVHLAHGTYLLDELLVLPDAEHWMLDRAAMGPSLTLADVGVHWWDVVEHLTGRAVASVAAAAHSVTGAFAEDTAAVLLKLDGGAIASATVSQAAPGHSDTVSIELVGTKASAHWHLGAADELVLRTLGDAGVVPAPSPQVPAGRRGAATEQAFAGLLRDVYAAVTGRASERGPFPTFRDGARGIEVLEAIRESLAHGRWVTVGRRAPRRAPSRDPHLWRRP